MNDHNSLLKQSTTWTRKKQHVLTSTVISITHCGTVSFSSMDSVSPPESLHSNLQTQDNTDATKLRPALRPRQWRTFTWIEFCLLLLQRWRGCAVALGNNHFPSALGFLVLRSLRAQKQWHCQTKPMTPADHGQQWGKLRREQCVDWLMKQHSYRGSPHSLPRPWGWCGFWARTPAAPGAAVRPGSLQGGGASRMRSPAATYQTKKVWNLTLWVGSIGAWKPSILCRHPGSKAVALIQRDGEHLWEKRSSYESEWCPGPGRTGGE